MKEWNENIYRASLTSIFLLFVFLEYYLHWKGFYSISADDSSHTLQAYSWFKNHGPMYSVWLPFQKIFNGTVLLLSYDLLIIPRVTSLIFGSITLIFLIRLSKILFDNKIVAVLTGLLGAISVPIVIFSAVPLMEIYFFAFILVSLTFFLYWLETEKQIYFWLTVTAASIANSTRYEAWLFSFFLFAIIMYKEIKFPHAKRNKLILLFTGLLLAAFPIYWLILSNVSTGHINSFVTSVKGRYHPGILYGEIKNNVLYTFLSFNISSMNILGIIPLIALIYENRKIKFYNIIFGGTLICFAIISFIIKANPTHNHWRIAMVWSLLLIPFTAYWLYYLLHTGVESKIYKLAFIVFVLLILCSYSTQINKYSAKSYLTSDDIQTGIYLQKIINKNNNPNIFIGRRASDKWRYVNILVASQNPDPFITDLEGLQYLSSDTLRLNTRLYHSIQDNKIKYLLLPVNVSLISQRNFDVIFQNKTWRLFELKDNK